MLDAKEVLLTSIESSRSGISCVVTCDCVDNLVDAFDVREALDEREVRPFFALDRFEGAVEPAKMKNWHPGLRR